jgi:hypothetical protein
MFVKNWKEVYKSFAVIFPAATLGINNALEVSLSLQLIPDMYKPVVALVMGALGWVISQNNIKGE